MGLNDEISLTPGSRAGLEPHCGGKSVAVQPIVILFEPSFGVVRKDVYALKKMLNHVKG